MVINLEGLWGGGIEGLWGDKMCDKSSFVGAASSGSDVYLSLLRRA